MPVPAGPMPKVRSRRADVLQVIALVRAARADAAARHAHAVLVRRRRCQRPRPRLALAQRQVHPLRQSRPRCAPARTARAAAPRPARACAPLTRKVSPRRWMRTPRRCLQQAQVLIERSAQVRQPRVVGRNEIEFARCFRRRLRPRASAARRHGAALDSSALAAVRRPRRLWASASRDVTSTKRPMSCAGPAKFTQRLLSVRPASSRASFFARALDQHALHAAHHALADGAAPAPRAAPAGARGVPA